MEIYDQINVGDVVELRKAHPCGGVQWQVDRTGADIGMVCLTCKRRVLIPRRKFAHQVKRFLQRGPQIDGNEPDDTLVDRKLGPPV